MRAPTTSDQSGVDAPADPAAAPRSRRDILTLGLSSLAGAVAANVATAVPAGAAAGAVMRAGRSNAAGSKSTSLTSSARKATLSVTDTSSVGGASAVRGIASSSSAAVYGVWGSTVSTASSSAGVIGSATQGMGIFGTATGPFGSGAVGVAEGDSGVGVVGVGHGAQSVGVVGSSGHASGVMGFTAATSGEHAGVRGGTAGTSNIVHGVLGLSDSTSSYAAGVKGTSDTPNAAGVIGVGFGGAWGLWAYSTGSYAIGASGPVLMTDNCTIAGTLTKGAGAFRIDHPLDPEHRYLQHSFVESPEMKNVYDGVVTLDASGAATVRLPRWFQALNRDFRYQLTAIGSPAPRLHISQGVDGNRFKVAGGEPGQQVSWQVTGVRHDAYARSHPIRVEVRKRGEEVGRLLHATEAGRSASLALDPTLTKARAARRLHPREKLAPEPIPRIGAD